MAVCLILSAGLLAAHVGEHPSIHDTVAAILGRMKRQMSQSNLTNLTVARIESFLTDREREILGCEHLSFTVNVPVKVSVMRSTNFAAEPFWLNDREFRRTSLLVTLDNDSGFDVWEKEFDAGWVGLGVNSLRGGGNHYFAAITPMQGGDKLEIKDIYPGQATLGVMRIDEKPYTDSNEKISGLPAELENQTLVRTRRGWRDHGRLLNVFRHTEHPSSRRPDHVILTWSGDPSTSQTIQWRTSPKTKRGVVAYQKKSAYATFYPKPLKKVKARTSSIRQQLAE